MKVAYLDCIGGISGDMALAALIDAGCPLDVLRQELQKLPLEGYSLESREELKGNLRVKRFQVVTGEEHPHRTLKEILDLVSRSTLSERVKKDGEKIFRLLARAEGKVHNIPEDEVHFHEVGAVDSIVDILGAAIALEYLQIERVFCSPLKLGRGTTRSRHGIIPVPVPAVMELVKGIPVEPTDIRQELTTPTGAALAVYYASGFSMPAMKVTATGYGAGSRQHELPNMVRIVIGTDRGEREEVTVIETTIDDMNPEWGEHIMDLLFEAGALDVTLMPVIMKKSRPAFQVTVVCVPEMREAMVDILFRESTTAGVRYSNMKRTTLPRQVHILETEYGAVEVKVLADGVTVSPEYASCRKRALEKNVPLKKVYGAALRAWEKEASGEGDE
jgi:hypothetical protein